MAQHWLTRPARSAALAGAIATISLLIGIVGYHTLDDLPLVDAFLEAAMILGGMGPIAPLTSDAAKIFSACYALYSGLVLLTTTAMLLAPWLHRLLYATHRKALRDAADERDAR